MRGLSAFGAGLALMMTAAPALSAPQAQPPMNSFDQAFYSCAGGASFMMTYDSAQPATAKMRTSDNNKLYELKRTPVSTGIQFTGGAAKFWTDGQKVTVDGTQVPFRNCKRRAN